MNRLLHVHAFCLYRNIHMEIYEWLNWLLCSLLHGGNIVFFVFMPSALSLIKCFINHLDCPLRLPPPPSYHQTQPVSPSPQLHTSPLVSHNHPCFTVLSSPWPAKESSHTHTRPTHAWRPHVLHLHARVIGSGLVTCGWLLCLFLQMPGRVAGWNPSTSRTMASLSWLQGNSMEMWRKTKVSSGR